MKRSLIFFFLKNTFRAERKEIKDFFGFQELHNDSVYLSNSLMITINKSKEFKKLKDRVHSRLNGWNL